MYLNSPPLPRGAAWLGAAPEVNTRDAIGVAPGHMGAKAYFQAAIAVALLSGGGYSLRESLPFAVDSSRATAKFAKKTSTLKMSAPEM